MARHDAEAFRFPGHYDPLPELEDEVVRLKREGRHRSALDLILRFLRANGRSAPAFQCALAVLGTLRGTPDPRVVEPVTRAQLGNAYFAPIASECAHCRTFWYSVHSLFDHHVGMRILNPVGRQAQVARAQAESETTRLTGEAQADAARMKGLAEAEAIKARARALAENQEAVIAQQLAENWPQIVEAGSKAFGNVDNMVVLNGADGIEEVLAKALTLGGTGLGLARQVLSNLGEQSNQQTQPEKQVSDGQVETRPLSV